MMKTNTLISAIFTILIWLSSSHPVPDINIQQAIELPMAEVHMNIDKQAEALQSLGLSDITDASIQSAKQSMESFPPEIRGSVDPLAMLILCSSGGGDYNYETREWTPTSSQIYSFDVEVYDIENMYSLFFQGIASINDHEFDITNVVEDMSDVNLETGQGKRKVSFLYNGHEQLFVANDDCDWFDVRIFDFMNDLFEQNGSAKKLYFFSDGGQECIVFFQTDAWAKEFTAKTGYKLWTR